MLARFVAATCALLTTAAQAAVVSPLSVAADGSANYYAVAPHQILTVAPGTDLELALPGYDKDGDVLATTITSLPAKGTLYQLSYNYNRHGGSHAKRGAAITTAPTIVTGSNARLVYAPPPGEASPTAAWDFFDYTVDDGKPDTADGRRSSASPPGKVALLTSEKSLVISDFSASSEGWSVSHNGAGGVGVSHEASSRGALSYYIFSNDDEIAKDALGSDAERWQFVAPAKFSSPNAVLSYGGSLRFWASSASGDYSVSKLNSDRQLVRLTCSRCNEGRGITLAHFPSGDTDFDGTQKHIAIPLTVDRWMKDSQNPLTPWKAPTPCELVNVLSSLDSIEILGDHTNWYESMSIDTVELVSGTTGDIPLACYDLEHGTLPRPN